MQFKKNAAEFLPCILENCKSNCSFGGRTELILLQTVYVNLIVVQLKRWKNTPIEYITKRKKKRKHHLPQAVWRVKQNPSNTKETIPASTKKQFLQLYIYGTIYINNYVYEED